MAEHISLGLIVLDQNKCVQYWNDFISRCSDKSMEQALGRPVTDTFPEADTKCLHRLIEQTLGQGRHPNVTRDGSQRAIQVPFNLFNDQETQEQNWLLFPFFGAENTPYFALMLLNGADRVEADKQYEIGSCSLAAREIEQRKLAEKLEQANSQLLQSEKLAGIGQLAAGVAHEINNPIGYVSSNLKALAGYVKDMLLIIDAIDEAKNTAELKQLKQGLEYEYIRSDVESLIAESEDGLGRVIKIITALKDFSHIEEEEFRLADIHHGFDTTLNLVKSELKYKAEVIKEYGQLPQIECIASQLNQIIMNLLVNAAHAIEDFGCITLRTGCENEWAWFEVEDTGKGIAPEALNRIYEPFFTTKPVGKGTGLGLALSFSIVQKHHGRIEVFSEVGNGTRFRVWLPVRQPDALDAS
ncbi:ATP-binding protein [Vreelandella nanhaiensis]|uniref:histidine kinase n=1 Tax=Vreelandella nanhaiensis TaxID=1258546 RepID=A0A3S0XWB7_9GAMM|nr:ATP-binding protein [Halomonas nanhaiensis]RUR31714.1 ATP-binding protein [Halomonas nanhaiensis]